MENAINNGKLNILFVNNYVLVMTLIIIIIIASRDDDGGWYDYLQRQNVQLREMMCEMSEEI